MLGPHFYDTPPGTVPEIRLPDWLFCVWTRLSPWNFHLQCVPQHFIPTDLFQPIEVRGLRAGNIMFYSNRCDSFKQRAPRLHFRCIPCLHPNHFSRLKWYLPAYRTNSFCRSASTDKAADPLGSKSVHLRVASFHSSPPRLCPTVSSPFTGRI